MDGVFCQLGGGVEVELPYELTAVRLDGLQTDVKLRCDVVSGGTFRTQLQNFVCASCQVDLVFDRGTIYFQEGFDDARDAGAQAHFSVGCCANGLIKFVERGIRQNVSTALALSTFWTNNWSACIDNAITGVSPDRSEI